MLVDFGDLRVVSLQSQCAAGVHCFAHGQGERELAEQRDLQCFGEVLAAAAALQAQGLWVGAIRPPTVPIGQGRLRITLSAMHQSEHISALLAALEHLA